MLLLRCALTRYLLRCPNQVVLVAARSLSAQKAPDTMKSVEQKQYQPNKDQKQVQVVDPFAEKPYSKMSAGEKVVAGSKDTFYIFVIVGGIALTGFVGYNIFRELFSRETPNGIYSEAFKMCKKNEELKALVGTPMLGYGEEARRGRRWLVAHEDFILEGVKCMRMQFHIKGPITQALVSLEVRKDPSDKYVYRYLFVDVPSSKKPIVLIDNRNK